MKKERGDGGIGREGGRETEGGRERKGGREMENRHVRGNMCRSRPRTKPALEARREMNICGAKPENTMVQKDVS